MKKGLTSLYNVGFLIKRAYQLNPRGVLVKIPTVLLQVMMKFLPILSLGWIFNSIQLHEPLWRVLLGVAVYGGLWLCGNLLSCLVNSWNDREEVMTRRYMNMDISKRIVKMPYAKAESPQVRTFLQMIENEMNISTLLNAISDILMQTVVLAGLVGIICTLQPAILALLILVLAVRTLVDRILRKLWNKWREPVNEKYRHVNYFLSVLLDPAYGKEIRIHGLQSWISKKLAQAREEYIDTMARYNQKLQAKNAIVEAFLVLQELAVYLLLGYRVFFKGMLIGNFSIYVSGISSFSSCVSSMIDRSSEILKAGDFCELYRSILEKADSDTESADMQIPDRMELCFDHVSFRYPGNEKTVLDDICLNIRTDESVSVVGANGAGKTTLIKLLCRLYRPTSGSITINGVDIFTIPDEIYPKMLGVVLQDFRIFAFSIAENVALSSRWDEKYLYRVLEKGGLAEKVRKLPNGLHTSVGKIIDSKGIELSGGESQRLGLCRALYKNPGMIVLDEPTASLDPIHEYELYRLMYEETKDKCQIFISHRLASTRFTQKIAVIAEGKIAEYGSFSELMAREQGIFRNMYELQSAFYVR